MQPKIPITKKILLQFPSTLLVASLFLMSSLSAVGQKGYTSWQPAPSPDHAMLLGNGSSAAMVYGYPHQETIIINHAALYLPTGMPKQPIDMAGMLPEIKQLILDGKGNQAAQLCVDKSMDEGYGGQIWSDPYVPGYDIKIDVSPENIDTYERSVDFETGEAFVKWTQEGVDFVRSQFISRADSVMIVKISATQPFDVRFAVDRHAVAWDEWDYINSNFKNTKFYAQGTNLFYQSEFVNQWEGNVAGYEGVGKVIAKGDISTDGNWVQVKNTREVLFFNVIKPFKTGQSFSTQQLVESLNSLPADYNTLLEAHRKIHTEMFNRVQFELNADKDDATRDTEVMTKQAKKGLHNAFVEKQFYASRYNILSATGINPPNLQGIWSPFWQPPWSSDYTHDGNLPTSVSSFMMSNMPELMMSYFDYHDARMSYYRDNAKNLYGCRGIQIPSHTSSHGWNVHFDPVWCLLFWNGGAAWTAHYYYDYWLYTKDKQFLSERAYPFMKEAALFFEDFMTIGDNGKYVFNPSYSPENNPANDPSQATVNATMDIALVKELLRNIIAAGKELKEDKEQIAKWQAMLDKLPAYEVDSTGTFREWIWPGYQENHHHRHLSHLYGMYHMIDPEIAADTVLWNGVKKALYERMKIRRDDNGGIMVFGLVQMAWVAANLGDAEMVQEILEWLSAQYWSNSLATYHDPNGLFNMDLSGGFQTAVIRALLYSEPGYIKILPAKPPKWKTGSIKGIMAKGQIEIKELSWTDDAIQLTLNSKIANTLTLALPENTLGIQKLNSNGKLRKYKESQQQAIVQLQPGKDFQLVINLR